MGNCIFCGGELQLPDYGPPGRSESCDKCGRYIHCCRQCEFYNTQYNNECREPRSERVVDKESSNFCSWYQFKGGDGSIASEHDTAESSKKKLEDLFK